MSKRLQSRLRAGDRVRVRGEHWHVVATNAFGDCESLDLTGCDPRNREVSRVVLYPFDRPRRVDRTGTPSMVRIHRWLTMLDHFERQAAASTMLRGAAEARIDLHAYQLEPALQVLDGRASRILLADEVGLGKTIQAGLLLRELGLRGWANRVLVVTPSGLTHQWRSELARRFALSTTVMDAATARRRTRSLPAGRSPWSVSGTYVVSLDYVKRLEVMRAVEQVLWDVLVVDEAHLATPSSDRGLAIRAAARRARYVVLVTATPHAGREAAFSWLAGLGSCGRDDPLLVCRRTRHETGRSPRRPARLLPVRTTDDERRMHALVMQYVACVWRRARRRDDRDARLAMIVLMKRALSSAASLERSVARRLAWLEPAPREPEQCGLPLDDPDGSDAEPSSVLRAPALASRHAERAWLEAIRDAAHRCVGRESKQRCLARLLRRTTEPVLVFTEYRDTLLDLAAGIGASGTLATLHGDVPRDDRLQVERAFNAGSVRLLLATDVAGTGLNLQARCRWVINYELPWNPMRLEQRVGRVDRMGQSRPVHAVHLIATRTAEQQVLARLAARLDRVRAAVGNVDHILGPITPEWLAEQALCAPGPLRSWPRVDPAPPRHAPGGAREDAERELERLERHRRRRLPPGITITGKGPTWWTRMSRGPWPAGYLAALRVVVEDGLSMPVGQFPIACLISTARTPVAGPAATPAPIERAIVEMARRRLEPTLRARARVQTRFLADRHARFLARAIAREQALLRRITDVPATPRQTALFDRRAIRRAATEQRLRERLEEECRTRLARLRHAAERRHVRVELRLVARLES